MAFSGWREFFLIFLAAGLVLGSSNASAQGNVTRLYVIVAPGGSADMMARLIGEQLGPKLGSTVVVENKPGAGGNLATQTVVRSEADGTNLLLSANNHTINPVLYRDAGYVPDDLVPVADLMYSPSVVVVPASSPYKTLEDLLRDSRKQPGVISYGSAGIGTPSHVAAELMAQAAGIKWVHVPYRGSGPSMNDVAGGQIPVVVASLVAALPLIQSGRVRPLAVTSAQRWLLVPDIPAASEFGLPTYEHLTWLGLFAPRNTPPAVIDRLSEATRTALQQEAMKNKVATLGGEVGTRDAQAFKKFVDDDYAVSRALVKSIGLQAN